MIVQTGQVITVTEQDEATGTMEKMAAHTTGTLHRAFSVFIFNRERQMLLQRRALEKYHSGGLWSNACCSHPFPAEATPAAADRRLREELGFTTDLQYLFPFYYKADVGGGLTEHEYDHIFYGRYDGPVRPDPAEVMEYAYVSLAELDRQLQQEPERFTTWFRLVMPLLLERLQAALPSLAL